jgi:hypothetical protein
LQLAENTVVPYLQSYSALAGAARDFLRPTSRGPVKRAHQRNLYTCNGGSRCTVHTASSACCPYFSSHHSPEPRAPLHYKLLGALAAPASSSPLGTNSQTSSLRRKVVRMAGLPGVVKCMATWRAGVASSARPPRCVLPTSQRLLLLSPWPRAAVRVCSGDRWRCECRPQPRLFFFSH